MKPQAESLALAIEQAVVAVAVAACVLVLAMTLDRWRQQRRSARRLARFSPRPEAAATEGLAVIMRRWVQRLGGPLAQRQSPAHREELRQLLAYAGVRDRLLLHELMALRLFCVCAGAAVGLLLGAWLGPVGLLVAVIGGLVGYGAPIQALRWLAVRRRRAIQEALPNTLDVLVVSLDAGLAFDTSVAYLCDRLDNPVTAELRQFLADLRLGRPRREALMRMVERTASDEIRRFCDEVLQADLLGIGLAGALHGQIDMLRTERRLRAEALAREAPVKLMFPTVVFILPVLFIVLLGPAVLKMMRTFGDMG